MFQIEATRFWWVLDDGKDVHTDQCLHGHVRVQIGDETLEDDCTVSSTGLLLLRTLTEDHIELNVMGNQMLPNHGFNVFAADDTLQAVLLDGDPYGTDWAVRHDGDMIELETMNGCPLSVIVNRCCNLWTGWKRITVPACPRSSPRKNGTGTAGLPFGTNGTGVGNRQKRK